MIRYARSQGGNSGSPTAAAVKLESRTSGDEVFLVTGCGYFLSQTVVDIFLEDVDGGHLARYRERKSVIIANSSLILVSIYSLLMEPGDISTLFGS